MHRSKNALILTPSPEIKMIKKGLLPLSQNNIEVQGPQMQGRHELYARFKIMIMKHFFPQQRLWWWLSSSKPAFAKWWLPNTESGHGLVIDLYCWSQCYTAEADWCWQGNNNLASQALLLWPPFLPSPNHIKLKNEMLDKLSTGILTASLKGNGQIIFKDGILL